MSKGRGHRPGSPGRSAGSIDSDPAKIAGAAGGSVEEQRADAAAQIQRTLKVWRKVAGQADPDAKREEEAAGGERAEEKPAGGAEAGEKPAGGAGAEEKPADGAGAEEKAVGGEKAEGRQGGEGPGAQQPERLEFQPVLDGDMIKIMFNDCTCPTLVAPIPLVASGPMKLKDRTVCVIGDEYPPMLRSAPVPYTCGPYTAPGMGRIKITLKADNKGRDSLLLKGSTFDVELDVQEPAMMPTPNGPVPDPQLVHQGFGQFITSS
jgi:hypothetical protein